MYFRTRLSLAFTFIRGDNDAPVLSTIVLVADSPSLRVYPMLVPEDSTVPYRKLLPLEITLVIMHVAV